MTWNRDKKGSLVWIFLKAEKSQSILVSFPIGPPPHVAPFEDHVKEAILLPSRKPLSIFSFLVFSSYSLTFPVIGAMLYF